MKLNSCMDALKKRTLLQILACTIAGIIAGYAMPPAGLWPVLLICLPIFYLCLTYAKSALKASLMGYLFWFGYFVSSLYWIGNALLVEDNPYEWAWILAVLGLPALLAFFGAFSALAIYKYVNLERWTGVLGFSAIIAFFEFLRGHLFTGFPWNLFGYTWSETLPMLQILPSSDVYTLTLLTLIWTVWPALFISASRKSAIITSVIILISAAAVFGYGAISLGNYQTVYNEDIVVKIVQPNIPQSEKWNASKQAQNFFDQVVASAPGDNEPPSRAVYILWPETALTYRYLLDDTAMSEITAMLQSYPVPAYLFTGLLNYNSEDQSYSNALVMINARGEVSHRYDKHHLVPFGEYIPFQKYIPLAPIVEFSGFKEGPGPQIFYTPENISYSPLICYEIIFPHRSLPPNQNADIIFNVTNDAWYGISAGPHQHMMQARYRALENATPVFRSANTGISAVYDPKGIIVKRTNLFEKTVIYSYLPQKQQDALPPQFKYAIFLMAIILCMTLEKTLKILRTNFNCVFL